MVFCGGPLIAPILERCGAQARIDKLAAEGAILHRGAVAVEIEGLLAGLLIGERTALNFLQLMSGIATKTAQYRARGGGHARRESWIPARPIPDCARWRNTRCA